MDEDGTMSARILVVDDDTALAEMIGIVLRSEGFEPAFCADGAAAFGAFQAARPDLVLLDLMLPGKDGIEVCTQIRAESGVPIIMLTAKSDATDVVRGLESGADDYVVKPFNPEGTGGAHPHPAAPDAGRRRPRCCGSATSPSTCRGTRCAAAPRRST